MNQLDSPILTWRKSKGFTQTEAAIFLKLSDEENKLKGQGTLSRYETGKARPSPQRANHIEKLTNGAVTAAQLRPDLANIFGGSDA